MLEHLPNQGNSVYSPVASAVAPERMIEIEWHWNGERIVMGVEVTDLGYGDFDLNHVRVLECGFSRETRRRPGDLEAEPLINAFWREWQNEGGQFDGEHDDIKCAIRSELQNLGVE